jgi:hypothetical protein
MTRLHQWKSGTAALMAMAVTTSVISPLFGLAAANAQSYNIGQNRSGQQYGNVTIPSGVTLPLTYEKETINIAPGESKSLTLRIASDIIDRNKNVLIPAGTKVNGRLESVDLDSYSRDTDDNKGKGVRFVAQELEFSNGQRQSINATSRTYTTTQKVSQSPSTGQVLTDAAIGGGAGLLGSLITGNRKIDDLKPVLGAAAGAGASVLLRKKQANVFVLRPAQDLKITLNSNLNLVPSSRY